MNELSWLIYAADVAGSLKVTATILAVTSAASALGATGLYVGHQGTGYVASYENREEKAAGREVLRSTCKSAVKKAVPIFVASLIALVVFPSSGTLYAIAASEMGERVIETETAGKAVEALNAWLDRQIAPAPEAAQ